ncbi:hypothetical protein B0H13DRAFT_1856476 [Mycena leptocephala]|nr:hypothetical protein B0H13DRAFT_1856476 [Mycena leptocephala]
MSQPTETPRYATRKNVRDGLASPPASLRGSSRSTSPGTGSNSGARPNSRPVSPALLYSEVTTGLPRSSQSHGSRADSPQPSEVPALMSDVDFNVLNTVEDQQDASGPWSPVTRKNSRTHSVRSASPRNNNAEDSVNKIPTPSTITRAGRELSSEDWLNIARRYEHIAAEAYASAGKVGSAPSTRNSSIPYHDGNKSSAAHQSNEDSHVEPEEVTNRMGNNHRGSTDAPNSGGRKIPDLSPVSPAIPSGEGTSRNKGKAFDPRNFGIFTKRSAKKLRSHS